MKRLLLLNIIWLLLISTKVFGQQSTWAEIVLWNYPIDNQDTTVTRGVYVGDIDLETLTAWTKADEDSGTVDVKFLYQFWLQDVDGKSHGWDTLKGDLKDHLKDAGWTFWRFIEPTKTKAVEKYEDPVVGEDFNLDVGGRNLELLTLNFTLITSSADAKDRFVTAVINDPDTSMFTRLQCTMGQSANDTIQYSFFSGIPEIGPSDIGIFQGPMPPNLFLKSAATIMSEVKYLDDDDRIVNISVGARKGVQPEFDFKMPGAADSLRFLVSGNAENGSDIDIYLSVSGHTW